MSKKKQSGAGLSTISLYGLFSCVFVIFMASIAHVAGVRWVRAQVEHALVLLDARHPKHALRALRLVRSIAHVSGIRDTQLAYSYARALMECNKTRAASDAFRAITVSQPTFWPAHANLGSTLFEFGNVTGALMEIQEAIDLLEEEDTHHATIAKGMTRKWNRSHRPPVSHEHLAELYTQKGEVLLELPNQRCQVASCKDYAAKVHRLHPSNIFFSPSHSLRAITTLPMSFSFFDCFFSIPHSPSVRRKPTWFTA
jgi:tetratricopeptide (TPR) repeat protein